MIIPNVDMNDSERTTVFPLSNVYTHKVFLYTTEITLPRVIQRDDKVIQQGFILSELFSISAARDAII